MIKYIGFREFFLDFDSYYAIEIQIPGEYEFETEKEGHDFFAHAYNKLFLSEKGLIARNHDGNITLIKDYKIRKLFPNQKLEDVVSLEDFAETNIDAIDLYNFALSYTEPKTSIEYEGETLETYSCASVTYWFELAEMILNAEEIDDLKEILLLAEAVCDFYEDAMSSNYIYDYIDMVGSYYINDRRQATKELVEKLEKFYKLVSP
jgi:hypothetical protein